MSVDHLILQNATIVGNCDNLAIEAPSSLIPTEQGGGVISIFLLTMVNALNYNVNSN